MSATQTVLLGAIAGFTIFVGLPVGRLQNLSGPTRAFLNAIAIGVLVFLLVDVWPHAMEPVENALNAAREHSGSYWRFAALLTVAIGGLAIGLLGLVVYDAILARRRLPPLPLGAAVLVRHQGPVARLTDSQRHAFFIALGIGLHNLAEGLAIGQSAAAGELSLAVLLVIGFGLHNATEGFGIVAPLAGDAVRPSWAFLFTMGLIGGGPTFVGTIIGRSMVNDFLSVGALVLAAGSILYVVIQLVGMAVQIGHKNRLLVGVFLGLVAGLGTDLIVVAAGV
jgi:ZIP family zinc transporter